MSDYTSTLRAQAAMFDRVLDSIVNPARRVAKAPQKFPEKPDLIAEVEELARELMDAARLIEAGFPEIARMLLVRARQGEATAAKARRLGHV